ncbi:META domain-containing protein [Niabella beijingensis]|uniref:META domain-containing protein n=1 Tax=Niabella beijingensis TaxID=2872700 RepID=UPI001CC001EE|nr:META domain-containing protein [Niabella beijingensis]MBZ4192367.1 META domain-containing protein [Niabella beijingensis]
MKDRLKICFAVFGIAMMIACNRSAAPLTSTLHTEGLHHKWTITALNGYGGALTNASFDLRNVHRSYAAAGCDTIKLTPRFGHNSRISLDDLGFYADTRNCGDAALRTALKDNLGKAYRFRLEDGRLELADDHGGSLLKAVVSAEDEKGSISRKWKITKMINVTSDSFAMVDPFIDLSNLAASTAFVGCNQFRFPVTVAPPFTVSIGQIAGTNKYCNEAAGFESIISKALPLVAKYQVIGNRLKLFDKEDVLLLEAVEAIEETPVYPNGWNPLRREWMLKQLKGVADDLVIKSRASINLADLSSTQGKAGCNQVRFQTATGSGSGVRFSGIVGTEMFCEGLMPVEEAYLKTMPLIRTYEISGHFIKFKDEAGNVLIEAVAADWD